MNPRVHFYFPIFGTLFIPNDNVPKRNGFVLNKGHAVNGNGSVYEWIGWRREKIPLHMEFGGILDQVGIVDIPPAITITYSGNIPGSVADGTGYELA